MERRQVSGRVLVAVVADEMEEQALAILREEGARGVTIASGRGIGFPEHMTFFGLTYRGLESVLVCVLDDDTAERIAERLNRELSLLEPFKGLAFSLPVGHSGGIDMDAVREALARHAPKSGE
ncbi:hypothetical protein B1C78_09595 [Thioalkalivibrio denitrificans]|uniref:Uncharacterized protein n=1 Tax=Thioalkalivibrio denitrificans TaxID=108003 RepID=A0A1V3NG85_9GAMM|nr:hypothetical protein [Thioalkalivibrio denitrificans]OOG24060.1 hypothetical protein B1C78_09595 [Thioalkalivibrio denitrificans]